MAGYGFDVTLEGTDFDDALARAREALKAEGFGVLTTIDVRAVMREKLGDEIRPYTILGACNPHLARRAIDIESDVGLLLPCNVLVQQEAPGRVRVAVADPRVMASLSDSDELTPVMRDAEARLRRVVDALRG